MPLTFLWLNQTLNIKTFPILIFEITNWITFIFQCSFKSSYKESLELHLANKHKDEGVPEHLQIKAIRKKTRKSDRVETTIYETTLEPEYVTTEFVVTDATTEDHIAAHR